MIRLAVVFGAVVVLAACVVEPEIIEAEAEIIEEDAPALGGFGGIETLQRPDAEFEVLKACLTAEQQALVGQPLTIARTVLDPSTRLIGPNEIFVQDYQPLRANADYDADEIVTRVWCG